MSYTVLARKYRSRGFDDLVGQGAVTTTLRNAITSGRVHHGYLFCGTRGVGKTSMARILAKSLNCLSSDGPALEPCGKCDSCKAIAEGSDIDVIEIDAASNTGVDNIRELRSNAAYRPARSRYKIYIVDEVHMLSTAAFNALLKTLEEPPDHIKFIFATTEPQKVPATIQSRCQRFDFKTIPAAQIAERLSFICDEEKIQADEGALRRVARLANGSLRDGVSLLDQLLSVSGGHLSDAIVDEFLPAQHDEMMAELIDAIADNNVAAVLEMADRSFADGEGAEQWCTTLQRQIRNLMVLRICGPDSDLVDVPAALRDRLNEQAKRFDAPAYVFMIGVLDELRRAVRYSGASRALVEAALVRLSDTSQFASIEALLHKLDSVPTGEAPAAPAVRPVAPATTAASASSRAPAPTPSAPAISDEPKKKEPVRQPEAVAAARPATVHEPVRASQPRPNTNEPVGGARREDLRAVMNHPVIRQALELFDGSIVSVQRHEVAPIDDGDSPDES